MEETRKDLDPRDNLADDASIPKSASQMHCSMVNEFFIASKTPPPERLRSHLMSEYPEKLISASVILMSMI